MSKFNIKDIKGVIPAMVTCFDENEQIDEKRTRELTNYLIDAGVDGLYLTGSTGETFLMTLEERKRVVEIVQDEVAGRVPVIVHVGDIGTYKSIQLAKHAQEAGADAISSVPPFYWRFNEESIISYYTDITNSVDIPMIVYNIPLAGLMGYDTVEKLLQIPGVDGVKYTATTHYEITQIKTDFPDCMVYSGADEMATSGFLAGADGIIGSFYNILPEIFIDIYNATLKEDFATARDLQAQASSFILACLDYDYLPLMKRISAWDGRDIGYSRRPFKKFTKEEEKEIKGVLKEHIEKYNLKDIRILND